MSSSHRKPTGFKFGNKGSKKAKTATMQPSIFGAVSKNIEENVGTSRQQKKNRANAIIRKEQARISRSALASNAHVLEKDDAVYDYDSWKTTECDAVKKKGKGRQKAYGAIYNPEGKKVQQKSKYIGTLKDKANNRKRELAIINERRILKEQEEEREQFGDTEVFVTSGYKKKLEADKKWQIEQDAKDKLSESKTGNLGDLYRNHLNETTEDANSKDEKNSSHNLSEDDKKKVAIKSSLSIAEQKELKAALAVWKQRESTTRPGTFYWFNTKTNQKRINPPTIFAKVMAAMRSTSTAQKNDCRENKNTKEERNVDKCTDSQENDSSSRSENSQKGIFESSNNENDKHIRYNTNSDIPKSIDDRVAAKMNSSVPPASMDFIRKTTDDEITAARERYFLRKKQKLSYE